MAKLPKTMTLKFGSSKRGQAGVPDLFAALMGHEAPPKCETCGGVTKDYEGPGPVPTDGRCACPDPNPEE